MSDMDRYRYKVTPYSPIKNLILGKSIRVPFTADLNKEEVFLCMKHGPVYRAFPNQEIRVTGSNFNSLHKEKYGEEETVKESKTIEEEFIPEEDVKIYVRESKPSVVVEEPVEESIVEEEVIEDNTESDIIEEEVENTEEESSDKDLEEELFGDQQEVEPQQQYNNYKHNRKKNRNKKEYRQQD